MCHLLEYLGFCADSLFSPNRRVAADGRKNPNENEAIIGLCGLNIICEGVLLEEFFLII